MSADNMKPTSTRSPEDPMDELFRRSLGSHAQEPDPASWNRIRRDLLWGELLRFRLVNVPWYILVAVPLLFVSLGLGGYFLLGTGEIPAQQSESEAIVSSETVKETTELSSRTIVTQEQEIRRSREQKLSQPVAAREHQVAETKPVAVEKVPSRIYLASINMASMPAGTITFTDLTRTLEFQRVEQGEVPASASLSDVPQSTVIHMDPVTSYDLGVNLSPDMVFYKNNSSYYKYNYTFDIGGQYTRGRFYLQSGLGLTYSSDIGSYDISYKQNDSVGYYYSVVGIIVSAGKIVYSTSKVTVYDSVDYVYDYNTRNTYLYLQLPLKAGYNIISRPRFSLGVHGGGYYTMLVYKDEPDPGFYAPDSKVESVTRKDPERYTHSFGLTGGFKIEYKFSRNVFLMLEPNVKYSLNTLNENSVSGSQQPFSVGLRAGIWYRFAK